eukprot:Gb_16764 [translate_table: standard]
MAAASSSTTADSSYEAQELNALLLNSSSAQEICNACRAVESFVSRHNADQARYFYTISFPILLHKIFGFEDVSQPASSRVSTQSGGWIDLTSSPNNEQAANALINLLMPTGVLLSALFSADEENLVRYVFPSERLPSWIHSMLQSERGSYVLSEVCPALFKGRLKEDANGGLQVQLNVFEYYMFWFAYYPVCKENITGDNILSNSNDINMGSRRGSRSRFEKWASSIPGLPGSHHRVNPRKFNSSPYLQLVHLYLHRFVPFKAFIASPSSHIAFPSPAGMPVQSLFREEHSLFSRAEFVFHTFVQFWLVDNDPSPLPLSTCHSLGISFPFNNTCYSYVSPSADLIEVSRLLVNYLNSSLHLPKEELNSLPFSESQASLRWAITRQADAASFRASSSSFQKSLILLSPWSSLLRRPLYRSILRAFTFWPLGGSMKKAAQVVDVWLDYIEPWNTVAEGETEHILEEDVYLEAENKLLSDPAKISSPMPQRLLLKQKINNISGRSTVQGSMGEMRISYQYTDRWQNYVVANYHFYTSLVNHFLVFAHKFVHIDTEAILQMTHKVLNVLISSKELLNLLRRVDSAYRNVKSGSTPYSFDSFHKLIPTIQEQLQDWEDGLLHFEKEREFIHTLSQKVTPELLFFSSTDNGGHRMLQLLILRAEAEIQTGAGDKISSGLQSLEILKGLSSKIFDPCGMGGITEMASTYTYENRNVHSAQLSGFGRHTWADVKYKGDWMKRPIGNSEIAWLARLFVNISDWLNKELGLDHQENASVSDNNRDENSYIFRNSTEPTFAEMTDEEEEISFVTYLCDVNTWINLFSKFFTGVMYCTVLLLRTVQRVLRRYGWRINLRILAEKRVLIFSFTCIALCIVRKAFGHYSNS